MNLERIADYELVEYLTAGGMADLYLARSPRQSAPVVLKTIQKRYVDLTRVVKMFIDEGRIAKALDHPNIVRIYDVGEERGAYYIAMELINGRDLLAIARRGIETGAFLPLHLAAAIVAQVANGLCYAHEKRDSDGKALRIVHCDVSPGNVVVSFGGTAKIVDFGIARATIQLRAEDHSVAGKFNYMAPEQIRGDALDARADLFSLGVILYELTVGRRLFRGKPDDVKRRILAGDVPLPTEVRPEIPSSLEAIILRALATERSDRYERARDLRADLLAFIADSGQPAGKREIAEYLRGIFSDAKPVAAVSAETSGAFGPDAEAGEEDEDLALDSPLPRLAENEHENAIAVDPDDPEPPPRRDDRDDREDDLEAAQTVVSASHLVDTGPMPLTSQTPTNETALPPIATEVFSAEEITHKTSLSSVSSTTLSGDPITAPTRLPTNRPHESHPRASRAELAIAAVAILLALFLYWLARS